MEQLDLFRNQQKESWNAFSGGWKKWDELTMSFLHPMGQKIIDFIKPSGTQHILDVASGIGEPGLSIASLLPEGKVTLTDIAENMLVIANENAIAKNISNIETKVTDVCDLPFENNYFDAISCRFGFMFFPDMQIAANEMCRVLKVSGKIATTVWNIPEKNWWVTVIMDTIIKHMEIPANPSGAPGMFRCCKPGLMENIFQQAGFKKISVSEIEAPLKCGTIKNYWNMMTEIGAPIASALNKAESNLKERIKKEIFEQIASNYLQHDLQLDTSALLITANK